MSGTLHSGLRWSRAVALGLLTAAALVIWLQRSLPQEPSSTFVGRSPEQIRTEAHREYLKFLNTLRNLGGSNAQECGAIALHDSAENSLNCGASALGSGKPFWLALQVQDTDSEVWTGLVQNREQTTFSVAFNSDKSRGGWPAANPSLVVAECYCPEIHSQIPQRQQAFSCICPVP